MPSRVIRGEILASESLARVSLEADAFFGRLLLVVDDYGRFDARPLVLRSRAYPIREGVGLEQIEAWLVELEHADGETGPLERYVFDGKPYLQIVNWERYRPKNKRAAKSLYPDRNGEKTLPNRDASSDLPGDPRSAADPRPSDEGRRTTDVGRRTEGAPSPSAPGVRRTPSSPTKGGSRIDAHASTGAGAAPAAPASGRHPRRARIGGPELPKEPDAGRSHAGAPMPARVAVEKVLRGIAREA